MPRALIINSPYYQDVSALLLKGASECLESNGVGFDVLDVPGALEIPAAIALAADRYDGFVALGCVIRGETSHYDIVAGESARALMDLTVNKGLAIGNGILTCESKTQAIVRADPEQKNKGRGAAEAALALLEIRERYKS